MKTYRIVLIESGEGWASGCPELPGCWSQGATRQEAMDNIREAIRDWLDAAASEVSAVIEETVTV